MFSLLFEPLDKVLPLKTQTYLALQRLCISTVRDLIFYRPYSIQIKNISANLSMLKDGEYIQTKVTIKEIEIPKLKRLPIKILAGNQTGDILLIFFNTIPPYIFNRLKIGSSHEIAGKVQYFNPYFQISHPEFILDQRLSQSVEPIYHLTYGLSNKQIYSYILKCIDLVNGSIAKILDLKLKKYLEELLTDLNALHHGNQEERILRSLAAKELIANQIALKQVRQKRQQKNGRSFRQATDLHQKILSNLGFDLTEGQKEALDEIQLDQHNELQMMRLLHGDVGAGKTLIALLSMVNVANAGAQSALMVPTDLLANQHFQSFCKALEGININTALLTGKTSAAERRRISAGLEDGTIQILIGTHALFQEKVNFLNLAFVVIDEQHRFGVNQRLELINKAEHPDVLVMTATPIPRSLTLTMFGDMAVSKITSKPSNRLPITTSAISTNKITEVASSLAKKLAAGEKVYWVCPLIDQNDDLIEKEDNISYADVTTRANFLEQFYPSKVGILHGKMSADQKEQVMQRFKTGEIQILVATTVIEVGIDVPDATLIIIENAEKFGLAQLHQLRGRVGRGSLQSHCLLLYNSKRLSANAKQRLEIMRESNDGFYIAEKDLLLRGGGEVLGTRQSGEPRFFFVDLARDLDLLVKAHKFAEEISFCEIHSFQIELFDRAKEELVKSG